MKPWMKPSRLEWLTFLSLMPVITVILNLVLFGERVWVEKEIWFYSFPLIFLQGMASWYLHIVVMHWLRVKFPDINQTVKRLVILAIAHLTMSVLSFVIMFYGYHITDFLGYTFNFERFKFTILLAVALNMIATTQWEADYTYHQWKNSLMEKEKLKQLNIQQEFNFLKSQVNPHFLFNCFNTLSSLISEDVKQADQFLNELSKVYRYLLKNNENGLSTLQTEIRFIESYFKLLHTRHGNALQLNIEIDKRYENYLLPSLSLQLLVENAVKHNTISRQSPLVIDIFTAAGNILVVNNNYQPKQFKAVSNKIGLENIRCKYELMNQRGFRIIEDSKNFSVVLPLMWGPAIEQYINSINAKSLTPQN